VVYSGVIPNMSGITPHHGLSFWIRASFCYNLLCAEYVRILNLPSQLTLASQFLGFARTQNRAAYDAN